MSIPDYLIQGSHPRLVFRSKGFDYDAIPLLDQEKLKVLANWRLKLAHIACIDGRTGESGCIHS
jgi:hypothetical protein